MGHLFKWALMFACILTPIAFLALLTANPDQNFWFVAYPPVPPYATHVQYLGGGSLPGYRITRFETDQPPVRTRQFYRTELPKRGWYFLCSPTQLEQPGCPMGLSPEVERADAYTRAHEPLQVRGIDVIIYRPGEYQTVSEHRVVEIIEYRYVLPTP